MSREVRRVPVDWKHPTEPNPYWREQAAMRVRRSGPDPKLHAVDERFVPLYRQSLSEAQAEWDAGDAAWTARDITHSELAWDVKFYVTGGEDREGVRREPEPLTVYNLDSEVVWRGVCTSVDELVTRKPWTDEHGERPKQGYMPDFDVPQERLGWCLYETVSEGCPVTPVFTTAEELVDHLVAHGGDWDQTPWRRPAAEQLVRQGSSFGSLVAIQGADGNVALLDGARDADLLAQRLRS